MQEDRRHSDHQRALPGQHPAAAAALVHYANIEQGYHITYWSIGNEPDIELLDGKKIDPVYYNKEWRAIALAMEAVDRPLN